MSHTPRRLRVAILGDRGIPARYGGYSTFLEEVTVRLVSDYDCDVVVYCRSQYYPERMPTFKGVRLVYIPVLRSKHLESLLHTAMSTIHCLFQDFDAALLIDPGNAPNLPLLRLFGPPTALHADGLGFKRKKWGTLASAYYKFSERMSSWFANVVIADALGMREHYRRNYGRETTFVPYGCESGGYGPPECLARFKITPGEYYLIVTRIEPDNNTDLLIREYRKLNTNRPLIVVGGARFPSKFSRQIEAEADDMVRVVGGVYESEVLNALYRYSFAYLHGHEVGGTNPALLRAMAAGTCCVALETVFSREVMGAEGCFVGFEAGSMSKMLTMLEAEPERARAYGAAMQERASKEYRWDAVTAAYAEMFRAMSEKRKPGEVYRPEDYASRTPAPAVDD